MIGRPPPPAAPKSDHHRDRPCHFDVAGQARSLQSVAVRRQRLVPLATALEAQPGSDTRELARIARQVATTRT
ncbi:MAG TPA: hypothetical protein VN327_09140 [Pseudonocardiaceae bacterium]|jgi:hypothetical protein|nr:hypothetical protein [Pseudonocardiaceae bacterium]